MWYAPFCALGLGSGAASGFDSDAANAADVSPKLEAPAAADQAGFRKYPAFPNADADDDPDEVLANAELCPVNAWNADDGFAWVTVNADVRICGFADMWICGCE